MQRAFADISQINAEDGGDSDYQDTVVGVAVAA